MGFALYTERCPQCGGVCWTEESIPSRNIFSDCERCGWSWSNRPHKDNSKEKRDLV